MGEARTTSWPTSARISPIAVMSRFDSRLTALAALARPSNSTASRVLLPATLETRASSAASVPLSTCFRRNTASAGPARLATVPICSESSAIPRRRRVSVSRSKFLVRNTEGVLHSTGSAAHAAHRSNVARTPFSRSTYFLALVIWKSATGIRSRSASASSSSVRARSFPSTAASSSAPTQSGVIRRFIARSRARWALARVLSTYGAGLRIVRNQEEENEQRQRLMRVEESSE